MNKIATILLASSLVLGGYGVANAGHFDGYKGKHCKHGKHKGEARLARMKEKLGLSEQQVTQIQALKAKYKPRKVELRKKMKAVRTQLRELMRAEKVDSARIREVAQQAGKLKADRIVLRSEIRTDVNSILTAEQRAKKKEMFKGRHHRHHGHKRCRS